MNKEYTLIDDKVIVRDEDGNERLVELNDKLDDILVQENLIEKEEDKLTRLKNNIEKYKTAIDSNKRMIKILNIVLLVIMPLIIIPLMNYAAENLLLANKIIDTAFGLMTEANAITTAISIVEYIFFEVIYAVTKCDLNTAQKKLKGYNLELEHVEKKYEKDKEKLKELEETKRKINAKNNLQKAQINNNDVFKLLEEYCNLFYSFGYNEKAFDSLYTKEKLDEYLHNNDLSDETIEAVKEYYNEKEITKSLKK